MVADSLSPDSAHLWHVTLTVAGAPVSEIEIRAALERLGHEHPFLLSGRFAVDRAEVRYWEQAVDVDQALTMSVRLWDEHLESAHLPSWQAVESRSLAKTPSTDGGDSIMSSPDP